MHATLQKSIVPAGVGYPRDGFSACAPAEAIMRYFGENFGAGEKILRNYFQTLLEGGVNRFDSPATDSLPTVASVEVISLS